MHHNHPLLRRFSYFRWLICALTARRTFYVRILHIASIIHTLSALNFLLKMQVYSFRCFLYYYWFFIFWKKLFQSSNSTPSCSSLIFPPILAFWYILPTCALAVRVWVCSALHMNDPLPRPQVNPLLIPFVVTNVACLVLLHVFMLNPILQFWVLQTSAVIWALPCTNSWTCRSPS